MKTTMIEEELEDQVILKEETQIQERALLAKMLSSLIDLIMELLTEI